MPHYMVILVLTKCQLCFAHSLAKICRAYYNLDKRFSFTNYNGFVLCFAHSRKKRVYIKQRRIYFIVHCMQNYSINFMSRIRILQLHSLLILRKTNLFDNMEKKYSKNLQCHLKKKNWEKGSTFSFGITNECGIFQACLLNYNQQVVQGHRSQPTP